MKNEFWKPNALGLVALLAAFVAIGLHFYQKPPRVGYAETAVLMSEFSEAIKAKGEFEKAQKEWDGNLKRINDSLTSAMNLMKSNYEKSSPKDREAMGRNLSKWNEDLQRYTQAVKRLSEDKEKELMTPVVNKMNSFMKTWGEQHRYDLILGTMNGGNLLEANPGLNITSGLLRDLNAYYRDPQPASVQTGKTESQTPAKAVAQESGTKK
jgi:outer membrane protein